MTWQDSETHREFVEEETFLKSLTALFGSVETADAAVIDALKWQLAREPNFSGFPAIAMTPLGLLRAITSDSSPKWPEIVVFFVAHADKVYLVDVMKTVSGEDDEEEPSPPKPIK